MSQPESSDGISAVTVEPARQHESAARRKEPRPVDGLCWIEHAPNGRDRQCAGCREAFRAGWILCSRKCATRRFYCDTCREQIEAEANDAG